MAFGEDPPRSPAEVVQPVDLELDNFIVGFAAGFGESPLDGLEGAGWGFESELCGDLPVGEAAAAEFDCLVVAFTVGDGAASRHTPPGPFIKLTGLL